MMVCWRIELFDLLNSDVAHEVQSSCQPLRGSNKSRCPPLPAASSRTTYAFTQMSFSSMGLFIASTNDLYITLFLHEKHRVTGTGIKPLTIWRWNIMTCSHSPRSWSSVSLHDCDSFFQKICLEPPPLCWQIWQLPVAPLQRDGVRNLARRCDSAASQRCTLYCHS